MMLFDDTYQGPRFTYGMMHRPIEANPFLSQKAIIFSGRPHEDYNFGTMDFPEKFDDQTAEHHSLVFIRQSA